MGQTSDPTEPVQHGWDFPADLPQAAWGIIANAGGGDWSKETPEWREAAERWRDAYHDTIKPFEFTPEHDGTLPIESAVFQALGAASMCWSETPRGVFDSTRAKEIGEALLARIEAPVPPQEQ